MSRPTAVQSSVLHQRLPYPTQPSPDLAPPGDSPNPPPHSLRLPRELLSREVARRGCQESCPNQRDGDCAAGAPGVRRVLAACGCVPSLTRRATAPHTARLPQRALCLLPHLPAARTAVVGKCCFAGATQLAIPAARTLASGLGCPQYSEGAPQSTRAQYLHPVRPSAYATVGQFAPQIQPAASYPALHILSSPPHLLSSPLLWRGSGAGPSARARWYSCCSSAACCPEAAHRPRQRRAPASRARQTSRRPGAACPTAWPKCENERPLRRSDACPKS